MTNIADILPDQSPGLPGLPPLASVPLPDLPANVPGAIAEAPPIKKVTAVVKVVAKRITHRRAPRPVPRHP